MLPKTPDQTSDLLGNFFEKALNAMQLRDFKLSVELFEKAIDSAPQNPLIYHKCAEAYYLLKEYKQAQEMNSKSLQIYQDNVNNSNEKANYDPNVLINVHWLALKLDEILSTSSKLFDTLEELRKVLDKYQTARKDEINRDINRISQMYQSKTSYRVKPKYLIFFFILI